jgi:hypothetical protein
MGISLTGLTPATTYDALIKVGDNGPIDATLKVLSDGLGTNLPMEASTTGVNFTGNLTQSGTALQPVLVSGTNIKTINSTSILGSGNIAVVTSPSGVAGAIQFSNGSAFASDATNLFWDDTNNRLGVGTNAPFEMMQIGSPTNRGTLNIVNDAISPFIRMSAGNSGNNQSTIVGDGNGALDFKYNGTTTLYLDYQNNVSINTARLALGAKLGVRGSGSTSATTSFLVQNSSAVNLLSVNDAGSFSTTTSNFSSVISNDSNSLQVTGSVAAIRVGTSITIEASAILQADSTTKGFLPPRMTTTQRNAIASPATGLVLYDSTTNKLQCYDGSTWNDLF